jgi:carbonic anhydrase/acetyltransferase-like protein (isoleucine patch superfamily)
VPPGKEWVVDFRLRRAIDRPAQLPDLAIAPRDVRREGDTTIVSVHNVGSDAAGPFEVAVQTESNDDWSDVARVPIVSMPAITHFEPVVRDVAINVPANSDGHWRCRRSRQDGDEPATEQRGQRRTMKPEPSDALGSGSSRSSSVRGMKFFRAHDQRIGTIYAARNSHHRRRRDMGTTADRHHCVLRGDVAPIRLGRRVNVQDGAVLHCNHGVPLEIGDDVIISHHAVVHCRHVGSRSLIGIRATVLDDCEIGEDCVIAASALVPPRTVVPAGSVVMGIPGKVVREIRDIERAYIQRVVADYVELARRHARGEFKPMKQVMNDEL